MPNLTAADIEKLCDDWCVAASINEGGIVLSPATEKFRLLANNVVFHELDHEALCAALIGLSKALLRPGLSIVVDLDHFAVWSWCGELLLASMRLFPEEQREIRSLYAACINAALANCQKAPATEEEYKTQMLTMELEPHNNAQLRQRSSLILAYLGFPLLEAVLKRACAAYVAFDGQVITAFSVPDKQGNPKPYGPKGSRGKRECSSLRDLLFLHSTMIAGPRLKALVERFRVHLSDIDGAQDPFDLVYSWRNQSLHGSTNFQTIGGSMLSLSLLISLFEIEKDFESYRLLALENCRWEVQKTHKSKWTFYPPI